MKNHWLDRKKQREEIIVTQIPDRIEIKLPDYIPPITVDWGTPPVISCVVTVTCPTYLGCSMTPIPAPPIQALPSFIQFMNTPICCSTTQEDYATQVNKGVPVQFPTAGDVGVLPGQEQVFGGTQIVAGFGAGN